MYPGQEGQKESRRSALQKGSGRAEERLVSVGADRDGLTRPADIPEFWNPQNPYRPKWDLPKLVDLQVSKDA